jgi:hypothetical protein
LKPTVLVLLSDKRSGSTFFQRELLKHPEIQTVKYSSHRYLETHHWLKGAMILSPENASSNLYKGYGSESNALALLIDTVKLNVINWEIPENKSDLVFGGWEALCKEFANPVFFEKSPQLLASTAALDLFKSWINTTEFDVKIIGLVRNPMSVLYSAQELFHTPPEKRQYGWMEIHKNLIEFSRDLSEHQFLLLKYEEMVVNTHDCFKTVCKFIGLEYDSQMGNEASRESLNLWKNDADFHFNLSNEVLEMAQQFGYTPNELENPPKQKKQSFKRIISIIRKSWNKIVSKLYFHYYQPLKIKWKNRKFNQNRP